MDEKRWIEKSEDFGFTAAAFLDTDRLKFDAGLRKYCEENLCGNYGINYACPPDCGTAEEMKQRVLQYDKALVVQTVYAVKDVRNAGETGPLKRDHNQRSRKLEEELNKNGISCVPILAGPCSLCGRCARGAKEPCRFPERIASCLSAYCICAEKMAEDCGMSYWCGSENVAFFSLFLILY